MPGIETEIFNNGRKRIRADLHRAEDATGTGIEKIASWAPNWPASEPVLEATLATTSSSVFYFTSLQ